MTEEEVRALEPGTLLVWSCIGDNDEAEDVLIEWAGLAAPRPTSWQVHTPWGHRWTSPAFLRLPTTHELLTLEGPT